MISQDQYDYNTKIEEALEQSLEDTVTNTTKDGLPEGIDAVRTDIAYHTARGWESISGRIVPLVEGMEFDLSGDEVKT